MSDESNRNDLEEMISKYLAGNASPEEIRFVEAYYDSFDNEPEILDEYSNLELEDLQDKMLHNIKAQLVSTQYEEPTRSIWEKLKPWSIAATVIIGLYLGFYQKPPAKQVKAVTVTEVPKDFAPGSNRATLTMSNGAQAILDTLNIGNKFYEDQFAIEKVNKQGIVYKNVSTTQSSTTTQGKHLLQTPYGGQYQVTLSDGTQVWLNAQSSLEYPLNFEDSIRTVYMSGECFFDVASDSNRPFVVVVKDKQQIKVLGTEFNVNAYADEASIKTTLHEGSVLVKSLHMNQASSFSFLKPGQQFIQHKNGTHQIERVDLSESIAWRNNQFQFSNAEIQSVMRQVSRWYQVEVVYEKDFPKSKFSGKIDRNANASQVLEILKFAGVKFKIESSSNPDYKGKIILIP